MYAFKAARPEYIARTVEVLQTLQAGPLKQVLGPDVILVPVPGHAPVPPGARLHNWPSRDIALALCSGGLGSSVITAISRQVMVQKSAFAAPGERPTPKTHFESMGFQPDFILQGARRITLIDDIVTKGSTMLAAASRIAVSCGGASVRGFAVMRTEWPPTFEELQAEPALQVVRYDAATDSARREA